MLRADIKLEVVSCGVDLKVNDVVDLSYEGESVLCTCRRTRHVLGRFSQTLLVGLESSPAAASIRSLKKASGVISSAMVRVVCQSPAVPSSGKTLELHESVEHHVRLQACLL